MKYYYTNGQNQATGPVSLEELKALLARSEITLSTNIVPEGESHWSALSSMPEFSGTLPVAGRHGVNSSSDGAIPDWAMIPVWRVEKALAWLKTILSSDFTDRLKGFSVSSGHQSVLITGALALLAAIVHAIRNQQPGLLVVGVAATLLLAVAQFAANRFLGSCAALLAATPTRTSSASMYDIFGLLLTLVGVGGLAGAVFGAIKEGGGAWLMVPAALVFALIYLAQASGSFHLKQLNVRVESDASAGEEAVGILAYFLKLSLFVVPLLFGLFSTLGALLQVAVLMVVLFQPSALEFLELMSGPFAAAGPLVGIALAIVATSLPFLVYVTFLLLYLFIDLFRAIVSIPGKLDALRRA